ncbi:MAG TPA: SGNH/GDSL hydrolase family protein [Vicinamibacterales bacterium]|nr:SGNH/GDSL hydrolase family protein [Vicinamibacterales bacterium]HJO39418.1 SGNH/GDSL hydrolase family protein [Vicinamibacterales bacterium]
MSVSIGALAGELSLRAIGFPYRMVEFVPSGVPGHFLMKPNQDFLQTWEDPPSRMRINSLGLRGDEIDPERCRTVLALGDSFTFEGGFVTKLQDQIDERFGAGIEVVNAGYGGATIDREAVVFEKQGLAVNPDLVILQFFPNDIEALLAGKQPERVYEQFEFPFKSALRQTAAYQLLFRLRLTLSRRSAGSAYAQTDDGVPYLLFRTDQFYKEPLPDRLEGAWERYFEELETLVERIHSEGMQLMVMVIPDAFQFSRPELTPLPQQMISRFAARWDIPIVDLLPAFRSAETDTLTLYRDPDTDGHLTDRGDSVVASALLDALTERNWVRACEP